MPEGTVTHSTGGIPVNADGDIPARARLLSGHTVIALADPNPEDPNSALLTHIQVQSHCNLCITLFYLVSILLLISLYLTFVLLFYLIELSQSPLSTCI